ncbi:MAG: nucleoside phosphorylase [Clostridia bacterium]|nr:nucleoside phosphorylase [Clostridia bacterium]
MILKFDNDKDAMISPECFVKKIDNMPETVIAFFEIKLFDRFLEMFKTEIIGETGVACKRHPVYKVTYKNQQFAVMQAGVGAPYCVGIFEEVIAMGAKNILLFGSCGSLINLKHTSLIIPTSAIRDEGTSYHYAENSDEIELQPKFVKRLVEFCKSNNIEFSVGKTWTTDAFYRETKNKVAERISQGCICVEMECSAMTALAKFRGVNFSQFFYVTDSLAKEKYDVGILNNKSQFSGEEKVLSIAFDCALNLFD